MAIEKYDTGAICALNHSSGCCRIFCCERRPRIRGRAPVNFIRMACQCFNVLGHRDDRHADDGHVDQGGDDGPGDEMGWRWLGWRRRPGIEAPTPPRRTRHRYDDIAGGLAVRQPDFVQPRAKTRAFTRPVAGATEWRRSTNTQQRLGACCRDISAMAKKVGKAPPR